jgi:hypothetical protein
MCLQKTDVPPYWGPRTAALRDLAEPPQNTPPGEGPVPVPFATLGLLWARSYAGADGLQWPLPVRLCGDRYG